MSKELNDKVSPSNKSVFDNLTEGQKNRILNAPIGTNVEGVNVDEKIKFELRQYEMSNGEERFPILSDTSNDTSNVTANNQPPESFSEFRNRTGNVEEKIEPVETPTFNKPPLSFSEYRARSGNIRGFYDIPTDAVVNTKEFVVSEERGYELLSRLDDYQGDNAQLLNFKREYNEVIYEKVYGGTGRNFEYNGKTFKPGDDDYNKTFLEIKKIINETMN